MRQLSIVCSSFVSGNGLVLCAVSGLLALGGLSAALAAVSGPSPAAVNTEIVSYGIYDDPSDEQNRKLIYWIVLYLEESDRDSNSIGWTVDKVKVIEFNDPAADRDWIDQSPTVDTSDGLWWVDHADLNDPQPEEFVMPPFVDGTADYQGSQEEPALDYDFEGVALGLSEYYFTVTAALTFIFTEENETTCLICRNFEPVEVEIGVEQPL